MKLKLYLALLSYVFLTPAICSDSDSERPVPRTSVLGTLFFPVTTMLDIVCKPLHYMSGSGMPLSGARDFSQAQDLLSQTAPDDALLKQAFDLLDVSAIEGYAPALYHMGRLMMECPEPEFQLLEKLVPANHVMAAKYLEQAAQHKIQPAQEAIVELQQLHRLENAISIAYGWNESGVAKPDKAWWIIKHLVKKNSPHASCCLAEAILKPGEGHSWIYPEEKNPYERRLLAMPLLEFALARFIPKARYLLAELELEDKLYEEICQMILSHGNEIINELKLGDAGFQERYIEMLCERETEIRGIRMTAERGFFLKEAMKMRINLLYQYFSDYSQYIGASNKIFFRKGSELKDPTIALKLMVDFVVGKKELIIPKLEAAGKSEYSEDKAYSFVNHGLRCPITPLDSNTAYRKLVELADDFTN